MLELKAIFGQLANDSVDAKLTEELEGVASL